MIDDQKKQLKDALRHGANYEGDEDLEFEKILDDDIAALEPLIDAWIIEARDFYFPWTHHTAGCKGESAASCTCGLIAKIGKRRIP